jgi:hypothetical protein
MRAAASTSGAQASHWTIRRAARPAGTAPPPAPPMLELRDNLTIYNAAYMALAEAMDATLLTGDRRLARAPGPGAHRDPPAHTLTPARVARPTAKRGSPGRRRARIRPIQTPERPPERDRAAWAARRSS